MPELTACDLYRSCRVEQFPHGVMQKLEPAAGLLDPDFYPRQIDGGAETRVDVDMVNDNGVEWVKSGGGTSLFDRPGVFTKDGWLSFEIPNGTSIPDSLLVKNTGYKKRFKATHYQIECRAGLMRKDSMQGALDVFARSAIARAVELGRLGK